MKTTLQRLFTNTLEEIALQRVVPSRVRVSGSIVRIDEETVDLDEYERIVVAALGKAADSMTASLASLMAPRTLTGVAVGPAGPGTALPGVDYISGEHPCPGTGSLRGAVALLDLVWPLGARDLVFYLLSGGGSALAECPQNREVSLDELGELHRLLVTGGADIVEMNVVRKHLSGIKGGRLAAAAAPARQVTMYVSDVPAAHPSAVASGPTMPDESDVAAVGDILRRHELTERLPPGIRGLLDGNRLDETPKPGDPVFDRSSWHCLLDNTAALESLRSQAAGLGWIVETDCSVDDWPLPDALDTLLRRLQRLGEANPGRTVCVLSGGELSCPVTGDGLGGRNQAFVLHAARRIAGSNLAVLSAGTDGVDGNSPAAGAVADGATLARADAAGLSADDYERRSDAFRFFEQLGDVVMTGPTGNNVRDVRLLVRP